MNPIRWAALQLSRYAYKATTPRGLSLIASWLSGVMWTFDTTWQSLVKEGYGRNPVVYSCVRLLSQSVPEARLTAYTGEAEEREELKPTDPLRLLIKAPNELMTTFELLELATIQLSVVGRTVWWKERARGGQVLALWPLRPDRVGPVYSTSTEPGQRVLAGYAYQPPDASQPILIPRSDALALNLPDPDGETGGIVEGLGPLSAISRQVAADNKATDHVGALLANYAQPGVALKFKDAVPNEEVANLIKAKFRREFGGLQLGTPAILDAEAEIQVLGFSLKDLEFPELRANAESRICAAFGVPAILAGTKSGLDRSTFSNMAEARQFFAETTLSWYWRRYADAFTNQLAAEFGEGISIDFDTNEVRALAGQKIERLTPIKEAFTSGVVTRNEYRHALGLDPFDPEIGDVFLVPGNVTAIPATEEAKAALDEEKQSAVAQAQQMMREQARLNPPAEVVTGQDGTKALVLGVKHLPGRHDQRTHGHGGGGQAVTEQERDWIKRKPTVEEGIGVNKDGEVVYRAVGEEGFVPTTGFDNLADGTFSHWHPVHRSTFSYPDIENAATYNLAEMRAVDSQATYSMTRPPSGWDRRWYRQQEHEWLLDRTYEHQEELLPRFRAGEMTRDEVYHQIADRVWREFAQRTGAKYTVTPHADKDSAAKSAALKVATDNAPRTEAESRPTQPEEDEPLPPYDDAAEEEVNRILRELAEQEAAEKATKATDLSGLVARAQARATDRLMALARDYREGRLTYNQWVEKFKPELAETVRVGHKLGLAQVRNASDPWTMPLRPADWQAADVLVAEQFKFFLGFRGDIQAQLTAGQALSTALDARAAMYGGALKAAYEGAKCEGKPEARLVWVRHKSDSCETCLSNEGRVQTAGEWKAGGVWPGHGTRCLSNCGCGLETVESVEGTKFNPYHDRLGRFTSRGSHGGAGGTAMSQLGQRVRDEVKRRGVEVAGRQYLDLDDTLAVGKLVQAGMAEALAPYDRMVQRAEARDAALTAKFFSQDISKFSSDEIGQWRKRLTASVDEVTAAKHKQNDVHTQLTHEALSNIREMGLPPEGVALWTKYTSGGGKTARQAIEGIADRYPRDWWEASNKAGTLKLQVSDKPVSGGTQGRRAAYYLHDSHGPGSGTVSLTSENVTGGAHFAWDVATHEMGHRFEASVPQVQGLAGNFLRRRTMGESAQPLGPGYDANERSRPDRFFDPYVGKDYSSGHTEVISMGAEAVLGRRYSSKIREADPEHEQFILGLLAAV